MLGPEFVYHTKLGILQFVVLKPLMAIISFALDALGLYWHGEFRFDVGYPYIILVDNVSQTIAL